MKENGGKLGKQYMDIPPEKCNPLTNITMKLGKNHSVYVTYACYLLNVQIILKAYTNIS